MKIIICTKRDLAGALVLNHLMPHLVDDQVTVLLSDKTRPAEKTLPELAEMKFLERDLAVDTIFPLVDLSGDTEAPLATFAGITRRYGAMVSVVSKINSGDGAQAIRDFAPDIIISVRFSLIFKRPIFEIPRFGTWNIHPGALPRYAGLFAPFRCLVDGGERVGCTLHRVDDGIDTGPVVGIGWLPVDRDRSLLWHVVNTYQSGIDLFLDMLSGLRVGRPPRLVAQDVTQRRYVSMPAIEQFQRFHQQGWRLFEPKEYKDILRGFLPPGVSLPLSVATAGGAAEGGGAPCCCARA